MNVQRQANAAAMLVTAAFGGLAGCDSSAPSTPIPTGQSAAAAALVLPGHIAGRALVGAEEFEADGLLSPDGELRLHLYQKSDDAIRDSAQLVAQVNFLQYRAAGQGYIVGQRCSQPEPTRFCGRTAPATIVLTALTGGDPRSTGDLTVSMPTGTETWWLRLGYWGGVPTQVKYSLGRMEGLYRETLADFAAGDDVIVSLDGEGRLFFQSSDTGCIGNGTLFDAFDGVNIYRAELTIASCIGARTPLNTELAGLATFENSTPWDYGGFGPKLWLSAREGGAVALTTVAEEL